MSRTSIVTGATGFLGSAFAAQRLAQGAGVIALTRADPAGTRTRAAVLRAAVGLGVPLPPDALDRLRVVSCPEAGWAAAVVENDLHADDVWHFAAAMSYDPRTLAEAFSVNVTRTAELYAATVDRLSPAGRFCHVSTAYTQMAHPADEIGPLSLFSRVQNPYQASKWAAELALAHLAATHRRPVVLLRPSVVVGSVGSGWCGDTRFGLYGLVRAIATLRARGCTELRIPADPDRRPNLIPVDRLVRRMVAVADEHRPSAAGDLVVAVNLTSGRCPTMREAFEVVSEALGITVSAGTPEHPADVSLARMYAVNQPFVEGDWSFRAETLPGGSASTGEDLDVETLRAVITPYTNTFGAGRREARLMGQPT